VQSGENGATRPGTPARLRRRDRHGRGLRGRLLPPGVPLYRTRSQQFDDMVPLPLSRTVPGSPESRDPARPATPARIVVYRRPLLARSESDTELSELIFDVVVEEFARFLGLDPDSIDPGYRGGLD
jgi:Zincin-like metallopeptidase